MDDGELYSMHQLMHDPGKVLRIFTRPGEEHALALTEGDRAYQWRCGRRRCIGFGMSDVHIHMQGHEWMEREVCQADEPRVERAQPAAVRTYTSDGTNPQRVTWYVDDNPWQCTSNGGTSWATSESGDAIEYRYNANGSVFVTNTRSGTERGS